MFTNIRKRYLDKQLRDAVPKAKNSIFHDPDACFEAMRTGSRSLAYFSTEVDSGRDLFRVENYNKIRSLAKTKSAESNQGAFSAAWKELWDYEFDQEDWNRRARTETDIYK